jgi:hypothetical protein
VTAGFEVHGRRLAVRLPSVGDAVSLWMRPELRTPEFARILRSAEVRRFVRTAGGEPIDRNRAGAIVDDPQAHAAYRAARDAELAAATEGGSVLAECPRCGAWRADLAPLALAVALRAPFWPLVDASGDLVVPALAYDPVRALPDKPLAAALSMRLPGRPVREVRLAIGEAGARLAQWRTVSDELFREGTHTTDWTPDSPGWRAVLRFASLVPELAGVPSPANLLAVTRLPLADFLFVDNVCWLICAADLPDGHLAMLRCAYCAGAFLPLAKAIPRPDVS